MSDRGGFSPMRPEELRELGELLYDHCGIRLQAELSYVFERRLQPRLQLLALPSFGAYARYLRHHPEGSAELEAAVELLTTNETYFFREPNQLRAFSDELLPSLSQERAAERRLRIWSAGCSTGEECYTIAILLLRSGLFGGWQTEVFGSDISRRVIASARRAEYSASALRATDDELRRIYFETRGARFAPREAVRALVSFGRQNLLEAPGLRGVGQMDVIFCRNVMIYFDLAARRRVLESFLELLAPGGYLLLGHSESLINVTADFELVHLRNDVVYRKPARGKASP